jgi:alpha-beta hydrolase superfamily lysophospholipase
MSRLAGSPRKILAALSVVSASAAAVLGTTGDSQVAALPKEVSFATRDGGQIHAHLYGEGLHAVVLAHGAVFDKESWQVLARRLSADGYQVLALDFRGYGQSTHGDQEGALWLDVLGATEYLRSNGARRVSALGASMGGGAVSRASVEAPAGTFDKVILLAAAPIADPERMKAASFLFIVSREERMLPQVRRQFELAPEPKRLEILEGSAHAQHVFRTDQAAALTRLIVDYLAE